MANIKALQERRTSVDEVFDHLYEVITTLQLRPGDKLSEAEVASQFGVSRQPVRDAFSRLENLGLLNIRPQRATEVRRFSQRDITKARFVRAAIEVEAIRMACEACDSAGATELDACLVRQEKAVETADHESFGELDYEFHRTLCEIGKVDFAFEVIAAEKAKVDRLCLLGLSKEERMPLLLEDHRGIADAVKAGDKKRAIATVRRHLARLDTTIAAISQSNAEYFET